MTTDTLPEELRTFVECELEAGHYGSLDELMVEGLRALFEREQVFSTQRERLRAQIAEGVAQAERGELIDGEQAVAEVRRRIDKRLASGE